MHKLTEHKRLKKNNLFINEYIFQRLKADVKGIIHYAIIIFTYSINNLFNNMLKQLFKFMFYNS